MRTRLIGIAIVIIVPVPPRAGQDEATELAFFEAKIRPILVKHCYECHSAKAGKAKGGLLLDSASGVTKGGTTGPALVRGDPKASLLIEVLKHEGRKMPPKAKLPDAVIADFIHWVKIGAPDPRPAAKESATSSTKDLWSLLRIARPAPPKVRQASWPRSDIDRFLLARLEAGGVEPARDAEPVVLLRRLHYVLTGLPPTLAELEQFEIRSASNRAAAIETTIDELLASRHFGERWARHWLDLARYADVSGATAPAAYPQAWRYRQYVIDAFNHDKPFDRFVREQIAGDLLRASTPEEKANNLIATGYLSLFHLIAADRDPEKRKLDVIDEQLDVLGKNLLGISLSCARCHDHKLDPVSMRDYYGLAGILRSTTNVKGGFGSSEPESVPLDVVPASAPFWMRGTKVKVLGVQDEKSPQDVAIRLGGDVDNKGELVPRGFPAFVRMKHSPAQIADTQSGRLQLADWLLSPENPLVARVIVNRIWRHVFGQGLVRSTDNFGTTGDVPSHPELLDYLAWRFREHHRWSFKPFIKELLLTRAWQLSARAEGRALTVDPDNRLLSRAQRRRQDAEALHDAFLYVAGRLDLEPAAFTAPKFGGGNQASTVNLPIPDETIRKRAVYWPVFRKDIPVALDMLTLFDMPVASSPHGTRAASVVPAQSLFLLHSPLVLANAEALAAVILGDRRLSDDPARVDALNRRLFSRPATPTEQQRAIAFVTGMAQRDAWARLCHTLMISNEFLVVQ